MIKISCAPANHFKALKNGVIRRQKNVVSDPLWRFAVLVDDVMFGRLFQEKPTLHLLWGCMSHVLKHPRNAQGNQALMAKSLDKAIPGFTQKLQEKGFEIFVPRGSSGGLAAMAGRWDKFLDTLGSSMFFLSEKDLTIDESVELAGNNAGIIGPIAHEKDFDVAHTLAEQVCILRGRDPKEGVQRWESTGFETQPHTSTSTAEEQDGLSSLIEKCSPSNVPPGYVQTEEAWYIYEIAQSLHDVRQYPAESDEGKAGRERLAKVLQQSILADSTAAPGELYYSDFSRYINPISVELLHWLGFKSKEIQLFNEGLADACRLPFVIDGAAHAFFRLPVQWKFENGIERTRKVRYLPWREVVEQHLTAALPAGCQVIVNDDFRGFLRGGDIDRFLFCCSLLHSMRHGRRYGEEKGKRASAAVPKGNGKSHETSEVVGVMRHPVIGASALKWKTNVDQELIDSATAINANLENSLSGLTFAFGHPLSL
ncbi:MAG: hypothetical protein GY862_29630 [Gammaproteobacteria bacterium]|nr:hypothetical protein [Gammaproteobacteria bacterium]